MYIVHPFFNLYMSEKKKKNKEIGVKLWIGEKEVPIGSNVLNKYDADGNLIVTFTLRDKNNTKVKLMFDKREYLDIEV